MTVSTALLSGMAAYPTGALVWFTGGPVAIAILAAGLLVAIAGLALELKGGGTSVQASPSRGTLVGCDEPYRTAA